MHFPALEGREEIQGITLIASIIIVVLTIIILLGLSIIKYLSFSFHYMPATAAGKWVLGVSCRIEFKDVPNKTSK